MSEIESPVGGDAEGVVPEGAAPPEAEPVVEPTTEPEPEYNFLDVEDPAASHVRITRDGEEQVVTFQEMSDGYNASSVAQQRFEEAAALRDSARMGQQVLDAMEQNPSLTIQALAQQYGLDPAQVFGQQGQQQQPEPDPLDQYADPLEREIAVERQARLELQQRLDDDQADRALMSAADGLKRTYSVDDTTVRDVAMQARDRGLGPQAWPMIYESMAFQQLQAQLGAYREKQAATASTTLAKQTAAADAAATVANGQGPGDVIPTQVSAGNMSLRDAFDDAWSKG